MKDMMQGTFNEAYGTGHAGYNSNQIYAGKTGTTSSNKDAWFCGFSSYYTTAVWIGYDTPRKMPGMYGSTYPLRIWSSFMNGLHKNKKQANFDLEEKRNEINNSRSLFIGALAGLAMAAVVGWFVLAPQYQSGEEEEVPVIRRPQEEVKIPPVEPGSVEISNQEKTVYDIIERKPENPEEANVLPPSEQPNADAIEALVEEVTAKENAAPAAKTNEIRAESLAAPAKPAEVKTEAEKAPVVPVTAEAAAEKEKPVAGRAEEPVPAETKAVRTAVKAERPAPKAKEAAPAAAKQETIAKGTWQIQLMSSPNKAAVEKSWKTMSAKYKILSGLPHEVSSVDLGAKGTSVSYTHLTLPTNSLV